MNEFRDAGCTGKVRFDSFNAANRIQKRRSRDRQYRKGQVYRCQVCRSWHIGQGEKERPKHELRRFRERYQGAE